MGFPYFQKILGLLSESLGDKLEILLRQLLIFI